jgi:hypothetical protein
MNKLAGLSILFIAGIATAQAPAQKRPAAPAGKAPAGAGSGSAQGVMMPSPAASGPTCFELSKDGKLWSRTPERMCVGHGDKNVEIKLQTGMPTPIDVAVFHLDLKTRSRCLDCNKDVYALLNPENSVMNELAITFDGKRDAKTLAETGTLTIGKTKFFYRKK